MDFGDPVPLRHALYDSESEEESEGEHVSESEAFTIDRPCEDSSFLAGRRLLVALGSTAAAFAKSFVRLREEPFLSIQADVIKVKRGTNVPRGKGVKDITHFHYTEREDSKWAVCAHSTELQVEYCNNWTEKVVVLYYLHIWQHYILFL